MSAPIVSLPGVIVWSVGREQSGLADGPGVAASLGLAAAVDGAGVAATDGAGVAGAGVTGAGEGVAAAEQPAMISDTPSTATRNMDLMGVLLQPAPERAECSGPRESGNGTT